jgi:hypothetical protein
VRCAAVDGVVGEGAVGDEVLFEDTGDLREVGVGRAGELRLAADDEPADVPGAGQVAGLFGGVGVGGRVDEQEGKLRDAAGSEVEGIFAGKQEDAVVGGDFSVGDADEFFEAGNPGAGGD